MLTNHEEYSCLVCHQVKADRKFVLNLIEKKGAFGC